MFAKIKSRKFQVWLVWLLLAVVSVFKPADLPVAEIIQYFGLVSLIYIGANVAQDYALKGKPNENA